MEKLLWAFVGFLLCCAFTLCVLQVREDRELQRQAVACEQYKDTSAYLTCLKPIREKQKAIEESAEDAAIISTSIMLSTAATIQ